MITIGLINEFYYISKTLKTPVVVILATNRHASTLDINIRNDILNLYYDTNHIWNETLKQPISMFGIESCSDIAKIMFLIDKGDKTEWKKLVYKENAAQQSNP